MFNSSIMIVLPLPWPTKAPFSTGLNGASSKLFFCVYFCLTNAPIERGAGLFAAFLALAEATGGAPGRRGREAPTPQGRGPLAPAPAVVLRAMGPQNAAAPAWPGQPFYALGQPPYGRRRRTGTGEAGAVGYAPGRRRLAAGGGPQGCPRPAKQKSAPGALGPGCALSGRCAPRRRPPGRWDFAPPPGGEGREGSQGVLQALEWRM